MRNDGKAHQTDGVPVTGRSMDEWRRIGETIWALQRMQYTPGRNRILRQGRWRSLFIKPPPMFKTNWEKTRVMNIQGPGIPPGRHLRKIWPCSKAGPVRW